MAISSFIRGLEPRTALTTNQVLKYVLWPLTIGTIANRVLILAINGNVTNDFKPVYQASFNFLNRLPVYAANFDSVDPHYLYPPSGTLLIAPLAILNPEKSRWLFIGVNMIAVIVAAYLLMALFKIARDSFWAPLILLGMFLSETVTNTLIFTNVNGLVLLGEVLFIALLIKRKDLWAGAAIGLTFAVKPVLAPLLLIALVRKQWSVFIGAIGVPVALTVAAWPLVVDAKEFFTQTLPYLFTARDYYNSALAGNLAYYGVHPVVILATRAVFAGIVVVSLWILYRYYRDDELFFIGTASGVLLIASWLVGSLGQMYYSMLVFPFLFTVALRNSTLRNWPAWAAIFAFMSYESWLSGRFVQQGRMVDYLRSTVGWSLILIVVFAVLLDRYLTARRKGRLGLGENGGLDHDLVAA